jgi:mannose-6-phosphate isomerase
MELERYIALKGDRVVGAHAARFSYFPILIKLLDSEQDLSVQVHPDNDYALRVEGEYGKTEFWYVVDCEPGASLIYGLNREVTRDELRQRIEDKTLLEVCNRVPVKPGDAFLIEAGTLHSIGGGITVAEIQQNSNTTYRVYDYGRLDKNGKPRELHVDKALDVVSLKPSPKPSALPPNLLFAEYDMKQLVSCEYFTVHEFNLHGRCHLLSDRSSFQSIMVLDGLMELECRTGYETLEKGASVFVPADYGEYWIRGNGKFLLTTV